MAYIGEDRVLLFGGNTGGARNDETWVYDLSSNTWTQKFPTVRPSARRDHTLTSLGGDQVLLFGGNPSGGSDDETWIYDLSENTWTQMTPAVSPAERHDHAAASLEGDRVLIFGGYDGDFMGQTCTYDLSENTWSIAEPKILPPPRRDHVMAHIGDDRAMLFGGYDDTVSYDQTWIYDLGENAWTEASPVSQPTIRTGPAMAYIGEDRALLFQGQPTPLPSISETWLYDLSAEAWTEMSPAGSPSGRASHAMAWLGGDQVLLFGGLAPSRVDETWVYDLSDNAWTEKFPTDSLSGRSGHAMAYIGGDQVLLFGGDDGALDDETWTYDLGENSWTRMMPATSPTPRRNHDLAWLEGDQVLLFGGYDDVGPLDGETWMYDLSQNTWTQLAPAVSPSARYWHAMAWLGSPDVLLFGGIDSGGHDTGVWGYHLDADITPPEAIDDLSVTLEGGAKSSTGNMLLRWTEPSDDIGVGRYVIYRSTDPTVTGDSLAGTADTSYTDEGAAGMVGTNYFYVVKAVDAAENKSAKSNTVGEFDINLGNGTKQIAR